MSDGRTLEQIVKQAIGECAGFVSLCWEPKPTGVYDSTPAVAAVDAAVESVMTAVNAVITAAEQRGYENGCIHGAAKYPDIYRDGVKAARDAVKAAYPCRCLQPQPLDGHWGYCPRMEVVPALAAIDALKGEQG